MDGHTIWGEGVMAKYRAWHPYAGPRDFSSFVGALLWGTDRIREWNEKKRAGMRVIRNNVTITREDLMRPVAVAVLRGNKIE